MIYDTSSFFKSTKVIELNINCGLCNRLQTIFYHYNILENNENLIVIWKWDKKNSMPGEFYDYFQKLDRLHFVTDIKLPIFYKGNGFDLNCSKSNDYSCLKLLPHIDKNISNEISKLNEKYIAIHVRRTDISCVYNKLKVKFNNSYGIYDTFINSSNIKNLYIATDNIETYRYFSEKYKNSHKINNNISYLNTKNRRKTTLYDSIIDLYMCINSTEFLGTELSSFTDFILNNRKKQKIE